MFIVTTLVMLACTVVYAKNVHSANPIYKTYDANQKSNHIPTYPPTASDNESDNTSEDVRQEPVSIGFVGHSTRLMYPIDLSKEVKPTDIMTLECPRHQDKDNLERPDWARGSALEFLKPKLSDYLTDPGFICETILMSTTCKEGWLGGETVTHEMKVIKSDLHDCLFELERFLSGDLSPLYYPEKDCHYTNLHV